MFQAFNRMFEFYQTRSNTMKHDETRSSSTKQGVQTVKCLVTKQCLMVFGRQTFRVCPGPKLRKGQQKVICNSAYEVHLSWLLRSA